MLLKGASILVECLKEQKVDTVFGYPGGAVLEIYDELYKHQSEIRHILTCHEQGAAHAADGYARATGKTGVCIATSGPGATNLVTGIATAYMDSVPMVAITGNVAVSLLGKDSFQEVDIAGVTMPITKHNFIVKRVEDLADTIRRAFQIAQSDRPGPVLVDIPKDVTIKKAEYERQEPASISPMTEYISESALDEAVKMIRSARQPFLYVGGGAVISGANQEIVRFSEKLKIPVGSSLMGLGGFPGDHPNFTGMIGMHGTKVSNVCVTHCDLLIVAGARFSDRVVSNVSTFAKHAKILHLDVDAAEVDKNVMTAHHVIGDLNATFKALNERLQDFTIDNGGWLRAVQENKKKYPLRIVEDGRLHADYILRSIYEIAGDDAILTTEVGQHQMWTALYYPVRKPRTLITSGGLGTMGYGFGAAMGAQLGRPDKRVFNIAGDGSFRMNLNELATAVHYQIPMIQVVMNNQTLGMVRQWQTLFYEQRYSQTNLDDRGPDFMKLADAFGLPAFHVTTPEEVRPAIEAALRESGPVMIVCDVPKDDKVFPMVAPGASIEEVMLDED
ncbi:biosynthetic-type acetolactate synthase large subunit [Bianquea renquensis]|uniref:Acetolactate synthase n=1 Tax=Bianquea renquensis TaxID=2763661 RepID=A0A926I094_9FIRM|nr:biosynthetic-type acetolactate synthase large subunit [Bianquea renquensis]MBC8541985.1 biosynthetic-type acetolactate synthase large subunit [Bianquea renquensis]